MTRTKERTMTPAEIQALARVLATFPAAMPEGEPSRGFRLALALARSPGFAERNGLKPAGQPPEMPPGFRLVTGHYSSGGFFRRWACLRCDFSVAEGGTSAQNHIAYENANAFTDELVAKLAEDGPMNAVEINAWSDELGVSRAGVAKRRKTLIEQGEMIRDYYGDLAEANDLPTTLAHFWRTTNTEPLPDEVALERMQQMQRRS